MSEFVHVKWMPAALLSIGVMLIYHVALLGILFFSFIVRIIGHLYYTRIIGMTVWKMSIIPIDHRFIFNWKNNVKKLLVVLTSLYIYIYMIFYSMTLKYVVKCIILINFYKYLWSDNSFLSYLQKLSMFLNSIMSTHKI